MRVNKAKRRWMAWQRYTAKTRSRCNHKFSGGVHTGMARAFAGTMFSNRYYPKGVREPWMLRKSTR